MTDQFATVHVSYDPEEILVMRSHLEAHKIPSWVFNEGHMSVNPATRIALGGMRLNFLDIHREFAVDLIHADQSCVLGDLNELICHNCGGKYFRKIRLGSITSFVIWLFLFFGSGAPFVPVSRYKRYLDCKAKVASG